MSVWESARLLWTEDEGRDRLLDIAIGLSVGPIVAKDGRDDVTEKCHDVAGTCCVWLRCARGAYSEVEGR